EPGTRRANVDLESSSEVDLDALNSAQTDVDRGARKPQQCGATPVMRRELHAHDLTPDAAGDPHVCGPQREDRCGRERQPFRQSQNGPPHYPRQGVGEMPVDDGHGCKKRGGEEERELCGVKVVREKQGGKASRDPGKDERLSAWTRTKRGQPEEKD